MRERRPAVQRSERAAEQLELHRQHRARWHLRVGLVVAHVAETRTREEIHVKLRSLERLVVEPQIRRQVCCGHVPNLLA